MNAPNIRTATKDDLPAIVALLADDPLGAKREAIGIPLDHRYFDAFSAIDKDPNQLLAVAVQSKAVIGCLQLTFIPGLSRTGMWRGQIESVRIAKSARGIGLGKILMQWAIEQCRAKPCGLVQLTSDNSRTDALQFYQGLGFTPSHEGFKLSL